MQHALVAATVGAAVAITITDRSTACVSEASAENPDISRVRRVGHVRIDISWSAYSSKHGIVRSYSGHISAAVIFHGRQREA